MRARLVSTWLLAAALWACGDSTGPRGPRITVISAPALTDTIDATPARALIVEVHDGAGRASGLHVRFETVPARDTKPPYGYRMVFGRTATPFLDVGGDTTDVDGRASVRVRFGTIAGDARLVVSVPALGTSDTIPFTVLAGGTATVGVTVRDTVLGPGGQYTIGGYLTDRWGNPVSGDVFYLPWKNVASVDKSGLVTAGNVIGSGSLLVRAVGGAVDTAKFSVLPKVQAAMFWQLPTLDGRIVRTNLDGSSRQVLATANGPAFPSPSPTSGEVVYHQKIADETYTTYIVDGAGTPRRLLDPSVMADARSPRFSADGQRVYLVGRPAGGSTYSVWRVRRDGTSLERLVDVGYLLACEQGGGQLAVSPDESRIVYCDSAELILLTLSTGAKQVIGSFASQPAFSPDGSRIAFTRTFALVIVNSDGSPYRTLSYPRWMGSSWLTWMPGGRQILARTDLGPTLIDTVTGEQDVIPKLAAYHQISVAY